MAHSSLPKAAKCWTGIGASMSWQKHPSGGVSGQGAPRSPPLTLLYFPEDRPGRYSSQMQKTGGWAQDWKQPMGDLHQHRVLSQTY